MSLASVSRMEAKLLLPTYERQPILFVSGSGVYLWDSRGKRYLDFLSGIGVNALGHNHPTIQATIKRQAGRLIHVSNLFFHEYQAELARLLTEISGLDRAFFCNRQSGRRDRGFEVHAWRRSRARSERSAFAGH